MKFKHFYESKRVIEPLYHVSNEKFRSFDKEQTAQGIIWFAKEKPEDVYNVDGAAVSRLKPVYLYTCSVIAHKIADWNEYDRYTLHELESFGYDFVDLDDVCFTFNPENIRIKDIEVHNEQALNENKDKKYWYHGDANEFQNFNHFRMDRDPALQQDELFNGPGIYFTEDEQEALGYAEPDGYLYRVELEGNIISEDHSLTEEMAKKLISWMSEEKREEMEQEYIDDAISSYEYDDEEAAEVAAMKEIQAHLHAYAEEFAMFRKDNFIAPTINLSKKYNGNEHAQEFAGSMQALGIDGFHVKFDGRNHVVMYNPKKIGVWEVEPYHEAYDRIYDEDY